MWPYPADLAARRKASRRTGSQDGTRIEAILLTSCDRHLNTPLSTTYPMLQLSATGVFTTLRSTETPNAGIPPHTRRNWYRFNTRSHATKPRSQTTPTSTRRQWVSRPKHCCARWTGLRHRPRHVYKPCIEGGWPDFRPIVEGGVSFAGKQLRDGNESKLSSKFR